MVAGVKSDGEVTAKEGESVRPPQMEIGSPSPFEAEITASVLLESLAQGVVVIDRSGTIVKVNDRAIAMFGYRREELIGMPHAMLIPERFRKQHQLFEAQYFDSPTSRAMGHLRDLSGLRSDGCEFPVEASLGLVQTREGLFVMALITDITRRKQAEKALQQTEELFHIQMACVKDYAIFMLDSGGKVLSWNAGAERLTGYRAEEIVDRDYACFYPQPEEGARTPAQVLQAAAANGQAESVGWRLRRDGSRYWADEIVTALRDGGSELRGYSSVTRDISDRKRAEDAQRLSEARYRALYDDNPTMIITIDHEFTMLSVNPMCQTQLGYTPEELEGQPVLKLFHQEDGPAVTEQLQMCFQNPNKVFCRQFRKVSKKGSVLWVEETAHAVYDTNSSLNVLVVCHDITERKRTEEALRLSEERFQAIFNLAAVGIAQIGLEGNWLLINQKFCDILGYRREELNELKLAEIFHPDELDGYCASVRRLVSGELSSYAVERRYLCKGGSVVWVCANVTLVREPSGEPSYLIMVVDDISDRVRVREELQQANGTLAQRVAERTAELTLSVQQLKEEVEEKTRMSQALEEETNERLMVQAELRDKELLLLQQSRLAAMGEMIGNIAHQWRQPLNLLGLLAQDLDMTFRKGDFDGRYLDTTVKKMLDTIRHMSQTIDDFRNFFRPCREKVNFRVAEIVERTISLLEGSLKSLQIVTSVEQLADPVVKGYPNEFSQVLLNIMINARDAFQGNTVADPVIVIRIAGETGRCTVTVTDNAGGIPPAIVDKIFDPYFTTKGPDKGTGVGLFMSKTIIEKNMGGTLSARNVGKGAEFRIEL